MEERNKIGRRMVNSMRAEILGGESRQQHLKECCEKVCSYDKELEKYKEYENCKKLSINFRNLENV